MPDGRPRCGPAMPGPLTGGREAGTPVFGGTM